MEEEKVVVETKLPTNGLAIAGFVLGLVSLLISLFCIVPAIAVVLSVIGFARRKNYANKGIAVAAFIISIGALVWDVIYLANQLAAL